MSYRVVFMGTPEFAVPCLEALVGSERTEVVGVVTQPDRPRGRGQHLVPSPVKECAQQHELPVYQPEKIKAPEAVAQLRQWQPDLIVVVAFGQILSQEVLDIPPQGCVNVHASLLPRYRGAAPMQRCLIDGETKTGVTTMYMDAGLDTGDMLLKAELPLGEDTTLEEVHDQLSAMGARLLIETIAKMQDGTLQPVPQTGESNYARMLTKETGHIDWSKTASEVHNLVRGLNSWPGAYTFLNGKKYKIWRTKHTGKAVPQGTAPGTIVCADRNSGLLVAAADELLEIAELQAPGKKKMQAGDYLNGHGIELPAAFES